MSKSSNSKAHKGEKHAESSKRRGTSQEDHKPSSAESNPSKKVKLNSGLQSKKNVSKHDEKSRGRDEKSRDRSTDKKGHQTSQNRKGDHHSHKSIKKKHGKDWSKKLKNKGHKKTGVSKSGKDKIDHEKGKKGDESKDKSVKEKDRNKGKPDSHKGREPEKGNERITRKNDKIKDKEKKTQLKLDLMMDSKEEKKQEEKRQAAKQKSEHDRQMQEIAKKYPQYVLRGKFKFPIDDKLFSLYSTLLAEHMPKVERPKPKNTLIPAKLLGDILQVWNFFSTFPELFKCEDLKKEEIYVCLAYEGDQSLLLLNDMHQGILSLFLQEFIKKNRFETYRDEIENPFFILLKIYVGENLLTGDELAVIWTEFARKIAYASPYTEALTETTKKFFDALAQKTCLYYNKLEYRMKIKVLVTLINAVYDTEIFRDFLQAKIDANGLLTKERNDLQLEIKQAEQDYTTLKAKVSQAERALRKEELLRNQTSRLETLRKQRDADSKKDFEKYSTELAQVEETLNQKQDRFDEINSELCMTLQTATLIGYDGNKSEYWVFQAEPNKIYVRRSQIVESDEEWYFYNKKPELDQLMKSLNTKGIKEKELLERFQDLIKSGRITFDDEDNDADTEQQQKEKEDVSANKDKTDATPTIQKQASTEAKEAKEGLESESDDDGYVVRKKEKEEVDANKNKPEEEPAAAAIVDPAEDKQKMEQEEAEKAEKAEKARVAAQEAIEKAREEERQRIEEKKRLKEQRKIEEVQELDFNYWLAKVIEYETSIVEQPDEVNVRVTRRKHQLDEISKALQPKQRSPKDLDITVIKNMILHTEESLAIYLAKWEAKWAQPEVREALVNKLKETTDIEELRDLLLKFNEQFEYSKTPMGKKGRPKRDRSMLEGEEEEEGKEEKEGDEDEEDEGMAEADEDEENEHNEEQERQRRNADQEEYRSELSSKKEDRVDGQDNGDKMNDEEEDQEEKVNSRQSRSVGDEMEKEEDKEEVESSQQEEKTDANNTRLDEEPINPGKETISSKLTMEEEGPENQKLKRVPLKYWGIFSGRLRKSWISFTSTIDNLAALYFSAILLCESVDKYVEKKSERYFTLYSTGKEYMAAKRREKELAFEQRFETKQDDHAKAPEQVGNTYNHNSKYNTRRATAITSRTATRENGSHGKSSIDSDSIVGRLRQRPKDYTWSIHDLYEQKPRVDERSRKKQEKLNELANIRRSVRITNLPKKRYDTLNEQQWETECKVCKGMEGGTFACSMCLDVYHPDCVGLEKIPEASWMCEKCLEKVASQRQTRSSTRRLQI